MWASRVGNKEEERERERDHQGGTCVHALENNENWRIHHKISEIYSVLQLFQSWKVRHVRQSANFVAHQLACQAAFEYSSDGNPGSCEYFLEFL